MFQIELRDPAKAEAIISNNIACPQTGIIFEVEEFCAPFSVQQCYNCQNFGHSAKSCKAKIKCFICGEGHSHKGCPNREEKHQTVLIAKDHMLLTIKGVQLIKKQVFRQHVVDNQKSYASTLKQKFGPAATTQG